MANETTTDEAADLKCEGCGMEDPCGIHFEDCPLLDGDDWLVVPAEYRQKTGWLREDVCVERQP